MFTHLGKPTALMPGDVITIDTESHVFRIARGNDVLERVAPATDDGWPFFLQLLRSYMDARGVAYAMAASAGHGFQELSSQSGIHSFEVIPAHGRQKKAVKK